MPCSPCSEAPDDPARRGVFVALETIDLRWSFDRLDALVTGRLGREVRGGALFVFFGRRRDAVKTPLADGSGRCLFYKGLIAAPSASLRRPDATRAGEPLVEIEERALDDLLDGIDLAPATPKPRARRIH